MIKLSFFLFGYLRIRILYIYNENISICKQCITYFYPFHTHTHTSIKIEKEIQPAATHDQNEWLKGYTIHTALFFVSLLISKMEIHNFLSINKFIRIWWIHGTTTIQKEYTHIFMEFETITLESSYLIDIY